MEKQRELLVATILAGQLAKSNSNTLNLHPPGLDNQKVWKEAIREAIKVVDMIEQECKAGVR